MAYDDSELRRRLHRAAEVIVVPDRPLRRRARPLPILMAAAATAVLLIVAVAAGQYLGGRRDQTGVGASATPTTTTPASPSASETASPTAPSPSATAATSQGVAQYLHPLVQTWRPTSTTVILEERAVTGHAPQSYTVVAVPADGGAPTPLIKIDGVGLFSLRRDGLALVAMAANRLALWDLRSGALRWLTPEEKDVQVSHPVWAWDGSAVYYNKYRPGGTTGDLGLFRINTDGTGETRIIEPTTIRGAQAVAITVPLFTTSDGLLVWGAGYEGSTVEVLELATGRRAAYGGNAIAVWRQEQPRFAVTSGCCGTSSSGGTGSNGVVLWNDVTGAKQPILSDAQTSGHDFSPDGRQVVVAMRTPGSAKYGLADRFGLMILPAGAASGQPAGPVATDAISPLWLRAGIAYLNAPTQPSGFPAPATELRIVDPSGAGPRTLYRVASADNAVFQRGYVSP
ncbi:MAG TPA: hypothetical protein VFA01_01700 [Candidatus Dormibacteraeota bacterium]|nr:hypothetical protein [Candidatus Dormibacteraeota bacterium]